MTEKKRTIFDYISSINEKKYIFDEEDCSDYIEAIVNRAFSLSPDTLFLAAEADRLKLKKRQHYDFLFYTIDKGKRFPKWAKFEKEENLDLISDHFYINTQKAKKALKCLTENDIEEIKESELWKKQ